MHSIIYILALYLNVEFTDDEVHIRPLVQHVLGKRHFNEQEREDCRQALPEQPSLPFLKTLDRQLMALEQKLRFYGPHKQKMALIEFVREHRLSPSYPVHALSAGPYIEKKPVLSYIQQMMDLLRLTMYWCSHKRGAARSYQRNLASKSPSTRVVAS